MTRNHYITALGLFLAAGAASAQESGTLSVKGYDLTYVSEGEGSPVLFVHGAISDHRVWEPLRGKISAGHRFVAYDQRYFGPSDWPDDGAGEIGVQAAERSPGSFRSIVHFEPAVEFHETARIPGRAAARREYYSRAGPAADALADGCLEDASLRFLEWVFKMEEGAAENEPEPWPTIWRENGRTISKMRAGWADARFSARLGIVNLSSTTASPPERRLRAQTCPAAVQRRNGVTDDRHRPSRPSPVVQLLVLRRCAE